MNQKTNINESQEKKLPEEKPKSSFLPSNYYYEKPSNISESDISTSMPSQYFNFLQNSDNLNEKKDSDSKTSQKEQKTNKISVAGVQQSQPFKITNNISISNYSFNDNQKKQIKLEGKELEQEIQRQSQEDELKTQNQKPKIYQNMQQQLYSFPNMKSIFFLNIFPNKTKPNKIFKIKI